MKHDPEHALARLFEGLDRLEMPYMVAGSVASSVHGFWRATNDVDTVVLITRERVDEFAAEFGAEFYLDADHIRQALLHQRAFNIIHLESSYKFDIFPLTGDHFQKVQFSRRRYETASVFGGPGIEVAVASPEDIILSKLSWYRKGGEVSEQQWKDILGVASMQRRSLDYAYLRQWAPHLKVEDLLESALAERHSE